MRVVQYTRSVIGRQTGDGLWQIVTTHHQLSVHNMSAIKRRPTHLHVYECLRRHCFRTRNIVALLLPVYLSCLRQTLYEPSPLLTTHYGSCVLDIRKTHTFAFAWIINSNMRSCSKARLWNLQQLLWWEKQNTLVFHFSQIYYFYQVLFSLYGTPEDIHVPNMALNLHSWKTIYLKIIALFLWSFWCVTFIFLLLHCIILSGGKKNYPISSWIGLIYLFFAFIFWCFL